MAFYASYRKDPVWTTIAGALVILAAAVLCVLDGGIGQLTLLLLLIGVLLVLLSPLILPTMRKGAAGRRYDASDSLKGAVTITLDNETLTVRSACQEGTVPLCTMTAVITTRDMTALVFGKELTVCIPMRILRQDEIDTLHTILSKKDLTQ